MDYYAKQMKAVSSKRKKTDADFEQLAKLEFLGSLYVNKEGRPVFPMEGVEAILVAGAKKSKEGTAAKAGVFCTSNALLDYKGPKTAEALWEDESFRLQVPVKVGTSRVVRTRPIFHEWSCTIELNYNSSICNEEQIFGWLKVAGEQCGAFDWRPKYGRFTVARAK